MEIITRTVYGAALQTAQLTGKPFQLIENTTLNEKLNILTTPTFAAGEYPRLQYVVIGNGGHGIKNGGTSMVAPVPLQHRTSDAAPFNMLPFVLRHVDEDIPQTQRQRYALRRTESHNGENYYAYYLRRLPATTAEVQLSHKAVSGGNTTVTPFVPTAANLNPVAPDIANTGTNVATGDYLTATLATQFNLDAFDISEILKVAQIIYGEDDFAIISEIGLVTGVERTIATTTSGGATINFNEVAAAQIHTHITRFTPLKFTNNAVNNTYNLGATEPLFL